MGRLFRVYEPAAASGERVSISAAETHHVRRVLRLRPGDDLAVFDGRGREWRATLASYEGASATLDLREELVDRVEPSLDVHLYQACARADRMDWVVQKGTEIGLAAVFTVGSDRPQGPARSARRLDRWRRIAVQAAKQSGRRRLPRIEAAAGLPRPTGDILALLLDVSAADRFGTACAGVHSSREAWLAVGPESGFSRVEIESARSDGWREVGLGPRVLRTETAGLVAASILLHLRGELG